jgi:UDPglucose 6-dehydrogenase
MENAKVAIYDPKVSLANITKDLSKVGVPLSILESNLEFCPAADVALDQAHAMVVLTEWDEFRSLNFEKIYQNMHKPAFVFDGRNILPAEKMRPIGFQMYCIGQGVC